MSEIVETSVEFVSLKCGFPETVHAILAGEKNITIDGVYTLPEKLSVGRVVFLTLGGDTGKKDVDWKPGFRGIAHVVKEPYGRGYSGKDKYFKFDICIDVLLPLPMKREHFVNYEEAFDAAYIGPELARDPSQALSTLECKKAVAVVRAALDMFPHIKEEIENAFDQAFLEKVFAPIKMLLPQMVEYGTITLSDDRKIHFPEDNADEQAQDSIRYETGYQSTFPRNRILFGAPGTGKSFTLNKEKALLLAAGGEYERVTFHPDYTYANFVGTYKPVPCKDSSGNDAITYSYVPGPFMRTYVKALKNSRTGTPKPYLLIIEEINRANVAAVFGDVFQLLDRKENEVSEYPIQASEDIKKYLADELGGKPNDYSEILIPDNMFIWATMNSADQGVFPMDTAFKRRWDFTYLGIDDSEGGIVGKTVILGQGEHRRIVEWNELRKAINEELLTYKVNEDKLMGPYFISKKMLPDDEAIDPELFARIFKNKVIMYLFDDAAKQKRPSLFAGCADKDKNQYSKICAAFDTLGVYIFCDAISSRFIDKVPEGDDE